MLCKIRVRYCYNFSWKLIHSQTFEVNAAKSEYVNKILSYVNVKIEIYHKICINIARVCAWMHRSSFIMINFLFVSYPGCCQSDGW